MKSTIFNSSPSKYQIGKCYLWNMADRKLIILCSRDDELLTGMIINIIDKPYIDIDYIIGYYSSGWGGYATLWTGRIELETD